MTCYSDTFPLHVFMGEPHGLHSAVEVLELFLVPLLSFQCLQSHWEESTESWSARVKRESKQQRHSDRTGEC